MSAAQAPALAALHARAFIAPPPWSVASFSTLLESPHIGLFTAQGPDGALAAFALIRVIGPEAELLTIATDPDARRAGHGQSLMRALIKGAADRGAEEIFLEVAEDNAAARALYAASGFGQTGRRPGYYTRPGAAPVDALLLSRPITTAG